MAESTKRGKGHIVMVPMMAHGHMIPFLALARQIQERTSLTITIATTPLNIQYLHSAISSSPNHHIHLSELPFNPTQHGLPPNIENTEKLPLPQIINLFHASKSLEPPLHSLVSQITHQEGHPPLCIISDVFLGWVTNVAKSLGTKNITFTTGGAYGTLAYVSIWSNLPHRKTDSDHFFVPGFPQNYTFHRTQLHKHIRAADGSDAWSRFFIPQIALSMKSNGWICNTVEEIEPLGLKLLRNYLQLPVWTVGPLQPSASLKSSKNRAGKESGVSLEACIEWLDSKERGSVLYICFGSQNTISASQMMALAEGLEECGKAFIWVIRPPFGFDMNGEFKEEWLPKGFEERMMMKKEESKRGLLVHKWGPQLEILSHRATGAFLSHCGWNSVLESLSQGVPIIGWPLAAEQAYNAKMLVEEMGVCVELTRNVESVVSKEEVRKVIEMVLEQEEEGKGKEMKEKASQIAVHLREATVEKGEVKGSSLRSIDDFLTTILSS